ncbi:tRNAHis guanylyltransferase-domain-containing protein [Jimgerdemannia flammicorona]|uniref:tRNA(His) guanylyltransferase n=1 Tax=Jimgerdemannia flammicorona TaxID=994334 RepID=A0A433QP76_9FUNG|nr:tRNAHis guanylyltransferase-domain-containing protein [Jimgerdemannia flammicorona]
MEHDAEAPTATETSGLLGTSTAALADLATLVRGWEDAHESRLRKDQYIIMRLDGHAFRTWTKGFAKPSDERINLALLLTTHHLIEEFDARTGYCHSDEITLILPPAIPLMGDAAAADTGPERKRDIARPPRLNLDADPSRYAHAYDGRVEKLCSLAASTATARFNRCMNVYTDEELGDLAPHVRERVRSCAAVFDCRVFSVPTAEDAARAILWRHRDCRRNAVMACAQAVFSSKRLHGVGAGKGVEMMGTELGWEPLQTKLNLLTHEGADVDVTKTMKTTVMAKVDVEAEAADHSQKAKQRLNKNISLQFMYGTFVKKEQYLLHTVDQKTGTPISVTRSRVTARSFEWTGTEEEMGWMAVRKYW